VVEPHRRRPARVGADNSSTSGDLDVFMDQPTETVDPENPHIDCWSGWRVGCLRWRLARISRYRRLSKTVCMEEVAGQDPLGLGGQELLPGQAGAAWCRVDTASSKEQPHRARCEGLSKPGKHDEDLGVLGCLRSGQQSEPAEELAEDQVGV
jgi:hypothetical protein